MADNNYPGPCVICGGTNYRLSTSGPTVCPACATGADPEVTKLRRRLSERSHHNVELSLALTKALGLRGLITPEMNAIADRVIAQYRAGEPAALNEEKK